MQAALDQLERLLRAYNHVYAANLAAVARETYAQDPSAACRMLNSDEWWDSRQSVAAIDLAVDGGFTPMAREDAQALRRALIEVFTTMLAYGEENPAGEIIVSQFQKWMESHV
ncbi:MAG: hypothetical protein PVJ03_01145 [Chromatiaceae bacterium]|jgi:propanediol dehydratase large subunit